MIDNYKEELENFKKSIVSFLCIWILTTNQSEIDEFDFKSVKENEEWNFYFEKEGKQCTPKIKVDFNY